ncbi:MAG: circadian clock KaiB family protein [Opitutaceae bacterium]
MTRTSKTKGGKRRPQRKRSHKTTAEFERLLREAKGTKKYVLRLYITGSSPRSSQAITNIRSLCEEHLAGRYELEVVDIYQQPGEAAGNQIIAAPTLVKEQPVPLRRMVGDLSNRERVLVGLDLDGLKTAWVHV